MSTCALCRKEKELRRSHILPDFFIKAIDGANEGGAAGKSAYQVRLVRKGPPITTEIRNRGSYEKQVGLIQYLFCEACEGRLSHHEGYVRRFFYGNSSGLEKRDVGTSIKDTFPTLKEKENSWCLDIRKVQIDYRSLKLFQLSLLWRAAICTGDWGKSVKLHSDHLEKLRAMLHEENPGAWTDYPCSMIDRRSTRIAMETACQPPRRRILEGSESYLFLVGGFNWRFDVVGRLPEEESFMVKESGELLLLVADAEVTVNKWGKALDEADAQSRARTENLF